MAADSSSHAPADTVTCHLTVEHRQFWVTTDSQQHPFESGDDLIPDKANDRVASAGPAIAIPTVEQWADIEVTVTVWDEVPAPPVGQSLGEAVLPAADDVLRCVDFHGTPHPVLPLVGAPSYVVSVWRNRDSAGVERYEVRLCPRRHD